MYIQDILSKVPGRLSFLIALISIGAQADPEYEIRNITPPKLAVHHIGQRIPCYRPMRRGTPNMSIEQVGNKIIAHNYGHGGSGWTLGPGSAKYVNNLLTMSEYGKGLRKDSAITVIGAGALGLFTAYDLIQRGYQNITVVAEKFDGLTSHNAGGLLAPVSMDNDRVMHDIISQIGINAYKFYAAISHQKNPDFPEGAILIPAYFENRIDSGLEPYVGKVMLPAKDVLLDFGNGPTRKMVAYDDGIFIDTAKMMTGLITYLHAHNVKFVQKKIENFFDIPDRFIINCSGLGATTLNQDMQMVPVLGHLMMLKDQNPKHLQYMFLVYLDEGRTKSGLKIKRSAYFFPKKLPGTDLEDVGVIGGTFIEGATPGTHYEEEFDRVLQNMRKFYGVGSCD